MNLSAAERRAGPGSASAQDAARDDGAMEIALSLISHTNVGKTALARTLLGRDVGEVPVRSYQYQLDTSSPGATLTPTAKPLGRSSASYISFTDAAPTG